MAKKLSKDELLVLLKEQEEEEKKVELMKKAPAPQVTQEFLNTSFSILYKRLNIIFILGIVNLCCVVAWIIILFAL